ncbi:MAG: pilus assembly protein [Alphaproteobacteria bacterium]|nr:pilus assembly protein [Alphaproteobacteria bacterium]NNF72347.1 pilus assembly protein [Paracoccaceae bacterium]
MKRLRNLPRRFTRSEEGTLSVETVIVFPIVLWALFGMFVFWDVFSTVNRNTKATYTIADLISREPDPIDPNYLDGLGGVYNMLVRDADANSTLRVSVVSNKVNEAGFEELTLEWSYGTGDMPDRTTLDGLLGNIPIMAVGDNLIVVETKTFWEPALTIGIGSRDITNRVVTSPRFVAQVLYQTS